MNIAIYARVSSETQAREGTIQSQLEALREYAKTNNYAVITECLDDGYSGAELNRPGLDQLRDIAAEGLIEALLVLSPDRLSRKQAHQIILLEDFKKQNIQVIFANQPISDSAEDQLLLQIQGAVSEYERTKIIDRTRRGKIHAVKNGQVLAGNPPYGYRYIHKGKDGPGTYVIDDPEAEIVRTIFDWYVNQGLKCSAVARRLEQEAIPSRSKYGKWWSSSVHDILKNETYIGTAYMYKTRSVEPSKHPKLKHYRQRRKSSKADRPREDWIGIPVPPLIDKKTWDKAQKLFKKNATLSVRNNKKNNYLLRSLVVCGLCGSMAPGHVSNHNTYYSCAAKRNKNVTTKPHEERVATRHTNLDEKVWAGLVSLLDDPDKLKEQLDRKVERMKQPITFESSVLPKIEQELQKLSLEDKRLLDAYREGVIELDELREQKAKVSKRLHVLKAKQKAAQNALERPGQQKISYTELVDLSAVYRRAMSKADFATRESIANLIINRVMLYPKKAVVEGIVPVVPDVLSSAHRGAP
ncbi:MAG: recombinase family protein [Chloroflexi bacterium]|nr:recombinase family protein [Chloroflexota bacterium]